MQDLSPLLAATQARHSHLCPRQVLGVRMALAGAGLLGLAPAFVGGRAVPWRGKPLLVIAETDGCFVDGLEVAAGVSAGHRTLRIEDYGKVAATFVNVKTGEAVRLAPQAGVRERALAYAAGEKRHYFAQLAGYQAMPAEELFAVSDVALARPIAEIVSRAGVRTNCAACGEEIINERELVVEGVAYCRSCAGDSYYRIKANTVLLFEAVARVL